MAANTLQTASVHGMVVPAGGTRTTVIVRRAVDLVGFTHPTVLARSVGGQGDWRVGAAEMQKGRRTSFSLPDSKIRLPIISSLTALFARWLFHPRTPVQIVR
jgi:hypothetical protein